MGCVLWSLKAGRAVLRVRCAGAASAWRIRVGRSEAAMSGDILLLAEGSGEEGSSEVLQMELSNARGPRLTRLVKSASPLAA